MFALVLPAGHELDRVELKHVSPIRLVLEHCLKHRLGLGRRSKELDDLMDLIRDDGVEDHGTTIRRGQAGVFGPLDEFASIRW